MSRNLLAGIVLFVCLGSIFPNKAQAFITPTPPFGFVDRAMDSANGSQTVSTADNLVVSGWAADIHDGAPVAQVQIFIDGVAVGVATLGSARPDVATALGNSAYLNSGWTFRYAAKNLAAGSHTVTAVATNSATLSATLGTKTINVTVSALFGFVDLAADNVSRGQPVYTGDRLLVNGWAANASDGTEAASVQVLIDGSPAGLATLGLPRPDVAAAGGNAGWTFSYAATSLTAGQHTVSAVATNSAHQTFMLLGTRTFTVSSTDAAPFGWVDKAGDASNGGSTITSGSVLVTGWAADVRDGSVSQVQILSDGTPVGNASLGYSRPDIATAYNNSGFAQSGWRYTFSASSLSPGTHTITAVATDSHTLSTTLYGARTITVQSPQVSGNISLNNNCGSGGNVPAVTLTLNTSPAMTTTSDGNGNFSFSGVPTGNWTLTPSLPGASVVFSPASMPVSLSSNSIYGLQFSMQVGYAVSGSVSYGGAETGPVYILLEGSCGTNYGTSISAPGSYTIHGVPPGTYTAKAWIDSLEFGYANAADASGKVKNVIVSSGDLAAPAITMSDPAAYTLTQAPGLNGVEPQDSGVTINLKPITETASDGTKIELATSYTVQWSTDASFTSPSSHDFAGGGSDGSGVLMLINGINGLGNPFSNGQTYYFRARGNAGGTSGPWAVYGGTTPQGVTVNPSSTGSTITGTVTFPGTATGPLYVGFYDTNTGTIYVSKVAAPTSPQAFSITVPNGSSYYFFGVVDQNNDGMIDGADITNTNQADHGATTAVSGNATMDLVLPTVNSQSYVTTSHSEQVNGSNTYSWYGINVDVRSGNKQPVAVQLTNGPNLIHPIDLGKCMDCGNLQFQYNTGIGGTPNVGDTYTFNVSYSDGTSDTITGQVTAVLNAFATGLSPQTGGSTSLTPTFSWTDPDASNYVYQITLWDTNYNTLWQVPSNNSNLNGLPSTVTSLTWGVDPTDGSNTPSVGSLTSGATYYWQVQVQDANGNQCSMQVPYQP